MSALESMKRDIYFDIVCEEDVRIVLLVRFYGNPVLNEMWSNLPTKIQNQKLIEKLKKHGV